MQLLFTKPDDGSKVSYLYQWDTNVVAEFRLENDVANVEGVFSTIGMTEGIRKTATKSGNVWTVPVPDKVLMAGTNVHVFITFVDADNRRTVQDCYISIKKCTRPEGYISTDTDEYVKLSVLMEEIKKQRKKY